MIDRKQIKAAAKGRMAQSQPSYWKVLLVWMLAASLLPQLVLTLAGGSQDTLKDLSQLLEGGVDPELALRALQLSSGQLAATWILNLVLIIYQAVLGFGLTVYTLRLWRGQPCGVHDLFSGFSMVGRVIAQRILVWFIVFGCVILVTIPLTAVGIYASAVNVALGGLLLTVTGAAAIIFLVVIILSYALVTIALADRPELGAMGAIQYGKALMRGHKGSFAVFSLSFFGWALLCALPRGIFIGLYSALQLPLHPLAVNLIDLALLLPYNLWLAPYILTASAGFYDALLAEKGSLPQMPPL